jgi:phosphatidylglycerol:prolipoprotein diacylglycerol transferase
MKPIPVVFHLGPLQVHTYGIGLAITFWFAYKYFERRLARAGYPTRWLAATFVWVIVAAIVGARVVHVLAHLSYYSSNPGDILAIWHGGLSSFGGLLFAVPTGALLARRRCPELPLGKGFDLIAPVLMAAWALGRLLGPQVMVAGGGKPTTAWYGMYYADQVGKRVPAPVFQAIECFVIWLVLIWVERRFADRPTGLIVALAAGLWGVARFFDEFLWLAVPRVWDSVEVTAIVLAAAGLGTAAFLVRRHRSTTARGAPEGGGLPAGARSAAPGAGAVRGGDATAGASGAAGAASAAGTAT